MKLLVHHKNFHHDFKTQWRLNYDSWSHLPKELGYDGHSTSSFLESKSTTNADILYIYTDLLNPQGEKKALEQMNRWADPSQLTFVLVDLSKNCITNPASFNPNESLFSEAEFSVFTQALQNISNFARSLGHNILYQPHLATGVQNLRDIEHLLSNTDINLLVDTAHMLYLKVFKLSDYLKTISHRLGGLVLQDYTPCLWVDCRRRALPYIEALSTNVFSHPADAGVKIEKLRCLFENLDYILVAGERAPHLTETAAALRSSLARLGFTDRALSKKAG